MDTHGHCARNILHGIGSLIDLGLSEPPLPKLPPLPPRDRTDTRPRRMHSPSSRFKVGDFLKVGKATVEGRNVTLEGSAKEGSALVTQYKVKPGERIVVRGILNVSGRLKNVTMSRMRSGNVQKFSPNSQSADAQTEMGGKPGDTMTE